MQFNNSSNVLLNDTGLTIDSTPDGVGLTVNNNAEIRNLQIYETLNVNSSSELSNTVINGDLHVMGNIKCNGTNQGRDSDILIDSELSVKDDAYIGDQLSVGGLVTNPVINTSNYTAIILKKDLIRPNKSSLVKLIN